MNPDGDFDLRVEAAPDPADIAAIGDNLSAFNEEAALSYYKRPLAVFCARLMAISSAV
jgi:hypothetical protein